MLERCLVVACGGGLGALVRYLAAGWVAERTALAFPLGTLVVNVLGCLLIGALVGWFEARHLFGGSLQLFVFPGLLGGFTTFSAFGLETWDLSRRGQAGAAVLYVLASIGLGLGAVWLARAAIELAVRRG